MSSLRYCDCEHLSLQLRVVFAVWKFWCGITDNRSRGRIGQRAQRRTQPSAARKTQEFHRHAHCALLTRKRGTLGYVSRSPAAAVFNCKIVHSTFSIFLPCRMIWYSNGRWATSAEKKQPSNFYHCQHEMSVHKCRTSEMTTIRNDSPNTVRIQFSIQCDCDGKKNLRAAWEHFGRSQCIATYALINNND